MKIFIDTTKWVKVKEENELPVLVGDNYTDVIGIYYNTNPATNHFYPTLNILKPNGRKIGSLMYDTGDTYPQTYTDADSNTWYYFEFTLSAADNILDISGKFNVTITTNYYNSSTNVITSQKNVNTILNVINAVSNDDNNIWIFGENTDDVIMNFKTAITSLQNLVTGLESTKADLTNNDQTIVAGQLTANNYVYTNVAKATKFTNISSSVPAKLIYDDGNTIKGFVANNSYASVSFMDADYWNEMKVSADGWKFYNEGVAKATIDSSGNLDLDGAVYSTDFKHPTYNWIKVSLGASSVTLTNSNNTFTLNSNDITTATPLLNMTSSGAKIQTSVIKGNTNNVELYTQDEDTYMVLDQVNSKIRYKVDGTDLTFEKRESNDPLFSNHVLIKGVETPKDSYDAANKAYVDAGESQLTSFFNARINKIESVQNVVDVVATYADLEDLDTDNYEVGDKVQVIADENYSGASTIYSWNDAEFDYVGAFGGNSYTKTQVDSLFTANNATIASTYAKLTDNSQIITAGTLNLQSNSSDNAYSHVLNARSSAHLGYFDFSNYAQLSASLYNLEFTVNTTSTQFVMGYDGRVAFNGVSRFDVGNNSTGWFSLTSSGIEIQALSQNFNTISLSGITTFTGVPTPTEDDGAANKSYVDSQYLTDAEMTTLLGEVF